MRERARKTKLSGCEERRGRREGDRQATRRTRELLRHQNGRKDCALFNEPRRDFFFFPSLFPHFLSPFFFLSFSSFLRDFSPPLPLPFPLPPTHFSVLILTIWMANLDRCKKTWWCGNRKRLGSWLVALQRFDEKRWMDGRMDGWTIFHVEKFHSVCAPKMCHFAQAAFDAPSPTGLIGVSSTIVYLSSPSPPSRITSDLVTLVRAGLMSRPLRFSLWASSWVSMSDRRWLPGVP